MKYQNKYKTASAVIALAVAFAISGPAHAQLTKKKFEKLEKLEKLDRNALQRLAGKSVDLSLKKSFRSSDKPGRGWFDLNVGGISGPLRKGEKIRIHDFLPGNITPVNLPTGAPWNCSTFGTAGTNLLVECDYTLGVFPPPTLSLEVDLSKDPKPVKNCAKVHSFKLSSNGYRDANIKDNEDCAETKPSSKPTGKIDLTMDKSFEATGKNTGNFKLQVGGDGSGLVAGDKLRIQDTLPNGVSITSFAGPNWFCAAGIPSGNIDCTYTMGTFPPNAITFKTKFEKGFENCASVYAMRKDRPIKEENSRNNKDCVKAEGTDTGGQTPTPTPSSDLCCTPWVKSSLASSFQVAPGPGGLYGNYSLSYQAQSAINNQMQLYTNYLTTINPSVGSVEANFTLENYGTAATPASFGSAVSNAAPKTINWTSSSSSAPTFWNGSPLAVNTWYRLKSTVVIKDAAGIPIDLLKDDCENVEGYIRISVMGMKSARASSGGSATFEFSDGRNIISSTRVKSKR